MHLVGYKASRYVGISTPNRVTFRGHPRGSTDPRWARSPRYPLSSLHSSVLGLLSPEYSKRFALGGTTATAVISSSRAEAFFPGMSYSLLPLPRGISGTSLTGKANHLPSLLTTTTSESGDGTKAGGSDNELSGTLSTVLPARRSVMSSFSRTVNP